jgi:N utilization substance protein B
MGTRRRAREFALQMLYQLEVQDQLSDAHPDLSDEQAMALFWRYFGREQGQPAPERDQATEEQAWRTFADELVRGVRAHLEELDAELARASRNWRLERMARVDRNLLRLALYELKFSRDVPAKVALNEAIEIAKRFGTAESPAFVNGILDRCLQEISGA